MLPRCCDAIVLRLIGVVLSLRFTLLVVITVPLPYGDLTLLFVVRCDRLLFVDTIAYCDVCYFTVTFYVVRLVYDCQINLPAFVCVDCRYRYAVTDSLRLRLWVIVGVRHCYRFPFCLYVVTVPLRSLLRCRVPVPLPFVAVQCVCYRCIRYIYESFAFLRYYVTRSFVCCCCRVRGRSLCPFMPRCLRLFTPARALRALRYPGTVHYPGDVLRLCDRCCVATTCVTLHSLLIVFCYSVLLVMRCSRYVTHC